MRYPDKKLPLVKKYKEQIIEWLDGSFHETGCVINKVREFDEEKLPSSVNAEDYNGCRGIACNECLFRLANIADKDYDFTIKRVKSSNE